MTKTAEHSSARERILDTVGRLFYRNGFQAVGIDTIIAESGVAKMTLYRHFSSKDDLIAAYLERSSRQFRAWLDDAIAQASEPKEQLIAIFEAVAQLAANPECLGCTFQGAAAEFSACDHPGRRAALAHKQAVRARLYELALRAGLRHPDALADQLLLLMDGALAAARMFAPERPGPAAHVAVAARALINLHSDPAGNTESIGEI